MKKLFFIASFILLPFCFGFEDIPLMPQNAGFDVKYASSYNSDVNYSGMKKSKRIEEATAKAEQNNKPRLEIDSKQINYQRALDYTTNQHNNFLLPRF